MLALSGTYFNGTISLVNYDVTFKLAISVKMKQITFFLQKFVK